MAATFDRELIRILQQAGCRLVRPGKGSHQIWYSPVSNRNFVVPVGIVSRHTANGVLRDAGLPKAF
jgi:predicted RNA binding protein YcfA (HicA-like mRNA interferase family)